LEAMVFKNNLIPKNRFNESGEMPALQQKKAKLL
jgi:hypothetical protein